MRIAQVRSQVLNDDGLEHIGCQIDRPRAGSFFFRSSGEASTCPCVLKQEPEV